MPLDYDSSAVVTEDEFFQNHKRNAYAEPTFDTWKERIFACVLDNGQNDFVYYRELFRAIEGKGYIGAIYSCLFDHDEEGAQQHLAEAKKLSTFKDTVVNSDMCLKYDDLFD